MIKKILKLIRPLWDYMNTKPLLGYIPGNIFEYYCLKISDRYRSKNNFKSTLHINCDDTKNEKTDSLDIVTIAFNNAKLIESQIRLMQKNLIDDYSLIIADNSNDIKSSEEIYKICFTKKVSYIKLPKNPWSQANLSHSVAMNWIYYNFIKPRQSKYFGFIDHDIFPTQKTSIINKFSEGKTLYGLEQKRNGKYSTIWYLWAGFCFFKSEEIYDKKINFSAIIYTSGKEIIGLDTGGGNWYPLYSKMDKKCLNAADSQIKENINYIDSWVHLEKASFKKDAEIKSFMEKLLN